VVARVQRFRGRSCARIRRGILSRLFAMYTYYGQAAVRVAPFYPEIAASYRIRPSGGARQASCSASRPASRSCNSANSAGPAPVRHRGPGRRPERPADNRTSLLRNETAGRDVPVLRAALVIAVDVAGRQQAQIDGAGSIAPDVPYPWQDRAKHAALDQP